MRSFVLLASLVTFGCSVSPAAEEAQTSEHGVSRNDPVALRYAVRDEDGWKVAVEGYSFSREQRVDVAFDGGGGWTEREAARTSSFDDARRSYFVANALPAGDTLTFAVHHTAFFHSGIEEKTWDKDRGANYVATADAPLLGRGLDIVLSGVKGKVLPSGEIEVDASVLVRDLAHPKTVEIFYSLDAWQTTARFPAHYDRGGFGGAECWKATKTFASSSWWRLHFAVVTKQGDRTIWDNNEQANYQCSNIPGQPVYCY